MQRHALAVLFALLAAALAAVAAAALVHPGTGAGRWVVGLASLALAGWLGSLALALFRRKRRPR
ncbi:MAG TPA: hypothetical protein VJ986_09485 [Gaiellaceae bacterium]|nr:hypothetical protein [Gaiellaceae bacterium]